jgi:hypothetical protein
MAAAVLLALAPALLLAQDRCVTGGVELDFNSRYLWRGIELGSDRVVQPSVWLGFGPLTLTGFGNVTVWTGPVRAGLDELDVDLCYSAEWQGLALEPDFALYTYPGQDVPTTGELSLRAAYAVGPFEPYTFHSIDLIACRGAYFGEVGVGWSAELGELGLAASAGAGWGSARFNEANLGVARSALNYAGLDAELVWPVWGVVDVRPHLSVAWLTDGELAQAAERRVSYALGVGIGKEF